MRLHPFLFVVCISTTISISLITERDVHAQAFGIELHNSMMPASGGWLE